MKVVSKGWQVNENYVVDGHMYPMAYCLAENINAAKKELLRQTKWDDLELYSAKNYNYINIPVKRFKDIDIVLYDGKEVKRGDVVYLEKKKKHNQELDALQSNHCIMYCYIIKGGYYYCEDYSGYTSLKYEAGIYLKPDAIKAARGSIEVQVIRIDIDEHNKMINNKIKYLNTKLL